MRYRKVAAVIAWCGAVTLSTLEAVHLHGFLFERLPRPFVDLLPAAVIAAFTLALYLSHAKHPLVIPDGIFTPTGTQGSQQSGLFVSNVGDVPALNVAVEPLGSSTFTVSFDPVPVVKVGGDRERVAMRYGLSVKDMFDVGTFLQARQTIGSGPGRKAELISHPIRFTYEDAHGRKYSNEDYEIGFIDVTGMVVKDARYTVRKRPKQQPRTLRERVGVLLVRLAARVLRQSGG